MGMRKLIFVVLGLVSVNVLSEEIDDSKSATITSSEVLNYVNQSTVQKAFNTEKDMIDYLKNHRKRTYFYFQKLDIDLQRKAFVEYIDSPEKNITDIIIKLYANKSKGKVS
jgi:hypothetical protein